jgi:hypothetical protein
MIKSFEIKSYPQLQFFLGAVNAVLLSLSLLVAYWIVLKQSDQVAADALIAKISSTRMVALLPLAALALVWAWVATNLLRLHDRVHEPWIRAWRASYDSDFILRSLLRTCQIKAPAELFERAYADKRLRGKFMQRLFYNFVGDETETAEGRRLFFYSEMARYWTLALVDLYVLSCLLLFGVYGALSGTLLNPLLVLCLTLVGIAARMVSNRALISAHDLSVEQVEAIRRDHAGALEAELEKILTEQGLSGAGNA